ncbi:MAG: hypothetical protein ACRDQA_16875 [Nocardioidaceae bacterium]
MSLAIFGLVLLGAVLGLAWKNSRVMLAAVIAVMLGLTIGASDGALAEPAAALVDAVRSALDSLGDGLFGGGA